MARVDTGNALIGSALLALAVLLGLGVAGVPFMAWLGEIGLIVAGVMMVRGALGAHPRVGWAMVVAGPALLVLSGFPSTLSAVAPIVVVVALVLGAGGKFANVW